MMDYIYLADVSTRHLNEEFLFMRLPIVVKHIVCPLNFGTIDIFQYTIPATCEGISLTVLLSMQVKPVRKTFLCNKTRRLHWLLLTSNYSKPHRTKSDKYDYT